MLLRASWSVRSTPWWPASSCTPLSTLSLRHSGSSSRSRVSPWVVTLRRKRTYSFSTIRSHCFNSVSVFGDSTSRSVRSGRRSRARNIIYLPMVGSFCCSSLICDGGMLGSVPLDGRALPVMLTCVTSGG